MKYIIIITTILLSLSSCKQKSTKRNLKANEIEIKSLDKSQESEIFSISDTMKIIHILILQEQFVKQAYVNHDSDYKYMLQILAENEFAYQKAYHEKWITTIQLPRDPKRRKKK